MFNKPTNINQLGSYVNLFYDANWARYKQTSQTGFVTTTTYYVGNYEIIKKGSTTTTLSYLGDTAIYKEVNGAASIRFTHKDRLGSIATFSDHNGNAKGYRSYDPFGKPKTGTVDLYGLGARLANNINDTENITKRGFTGHEHLDEVELIHMNGRVYDYNVGRFMSVDPFIQEPGNSQSVNPYSYVMNNPLGYTDPSGYSRIARRQKEKEEEYNETIAKLNENINKANDKISGTSDNGSNNNQDDFDSFGTIESTDIGTSGDSFLDNGEQHSPVFGDEAFYSNHVTFHHYDTFTPVCGEGTDGCTFDILNDDVLYHFSYPAKHLIATPAAIDGKPVVAYIVGPLDAMLGNTDNPLNYDVPVGRVIQIRTPDGGIQNQTLRDHGMYNGTITRKIINRDGNLGIWTHGIGVNMFISKVYPEVSPLVNPTIGYINKKLAQANDIHGPRAFAAMDAQAKQYWSNKYGN